jgi:hypothetical protein
MSIRQISHVLCHTHKRTHHQTTTSPLDFIALAGFPGFWRFIRWYRHGARPSVHYGRQRTGAARFCPLVFGQELVASIVAYRLEGNPLEWSALMARFNYRPLSLRDLLIVAGIFAVEMALYLVMTRVTGWLIGQGLIRNLSENSRHAGFAQRSR